MKKLITFEAKIYVGLKDCEFNTTYSIQTVYKICQRYVNKNKWCVTVTPTRYIYVDGQENGVIIGIINYPRFPDTIKNLKKKTIGLAKKLLSELYQMRISIVFSDETIMLET